MGRPKLEIDATLVEELAGIQCTLEEIAAVVGCDKATISRRFATEIDKGRERGKTSLRRMQWKRAAKGSDTMLIWLGKQYLGQSDQASVSLGGEINLIIGKELKEV